MNHPSTLSTQHEQEKSGQPLVNGRSLIRFNDRGGEPPEKENSVPHEEGPTPLSSCRLSPPRPSPSRLSSPRFPPSRPSPSRLSSCKLPSPRGYWGIACINLLLRAGQCQQGMLSCDTFTEMSPLHKEILIDFCDDEGTTYTSGVKDCYVKTEIGVVGTYEVICRCKPDVILPNCGLDLQRTNILPEPGNHVPNTTALEDLLRMNSWKNDFYKYSHYVAHDTAWLQE